MLCATRHTQTMIEPAQALSIPADWIYDAA